VVSNAIAGDRIGRERQLHWVGMRRCGALPLVCTSSVEFVGLTPIKSTLGLALRPIPLH